MGEYFQITCVFLSETTEPLVSKLQLQCVLNGHLQNVCTAWDSTSLYFLREKKILHIPIDKQCPVVSANLYF
jgi:hypothetical protein